MPESSGNISLHSKQSVPVPEVRSIRQSGANAQASPSESFAASEKPQTPIADTAVSSKLLKTNKRMLQHTDSSAAGKTPTDSTKPVEAPISEEAPSAINASKALVQQGIIRCIINRPDGEETTRLRSRPDGSQKSGVWVKGNAWVAQGEVVEVLRKDFVGENGFAFIRTANNTEGFVRSDYIEVESKNCERSSLKKQKQMKHTDDSIAARRASFASIPHASTELSETIDCSPSQVVSRPSRIASSAFFTFFRRI